MYRNSLILLALLFVVNSCGPTITSSSQAQLDTSTPTLGGYPTPTFQPPLTTLYPRPAFTPIWPPPTTDYYPWPTIAPDIGLDLLDNGWSAQGASYLYYQADTGNQRTLRWDATFSNPAGIEWAGIVHPLPGDMTTFIGVILRVYLESPQETDLTLVVIEADGDILPWDLNSGHEGWNTIIITDFQNRIPVWWTQADHSFDYTNVDRVELWHSDYPFPEKSDPDSIQIAKFHFIPSNQVYLLEALKNEQEISDARRALDLEAIGAMDNTDGWFGPSPDQLNISPGYSGNGLALSLDLNSDEHFRLERNFISLGSSNYPMALGSETRQGEMLTKDLSQTRSISFHYHSDVPSPMGMVFRIWDRTGGWLQWDVSLPGPNGNWSIIQLSIPPDDLTSVVNLRAIGGFIIEIQAGDGPVYGDLMLDELSFSSQSSDGLAPRFVELMLPIDPTAIQTVLVEDPIPARDFHIIVHISAASWAFNSGDVETGLEAIRQSVDHYNGLGQLEYVFGFDDPQFDITTPDSEAHAIDIIVKVAQWCEENQIPFYFAIAGADIEVPFSVVKAVSDSAPNYNLGVAVGEIYANQVLTERNVDQLVEVLEFLRERNKHLIFWRFADLWWQINLNQEYVDRIFSEEYTNVIVPIWENLGCETLAMGVTQGYWISGRVGEWGASTQSWQWDGLRWSNTYGMPSHDWLRMFVMTIASGATYMEIEPQWALEDGALEALREFILLQQKGVLLTSPGLDQTLSIPAVALQTYPYEIFDETPRGLLQCNPGDYQKTYEQVRPEMIARYLNHAFHYYENIFPQTPYGFVSILPQDTSLQNVTSLLTDGRRLFYGEIWYAPMDASDIVLAAYQDAAEDLPFRADGCFFSAVHVGKNDYLLYLIDAEERFPVGASTVINVSLPGAFEVYDGLTGQPLTVLGGKIPIDIPAGGFRLVRITQTP